MDTKSNARKEPDSQQNKDTKIEKLFDRCSIALKVKRAEEKDEIDA